MNKLVFEGIVLGIEEKEYGGGKKSAGKIVQIKGKGNGAIHPKYLHPILSFLRSVKGKKKEKYVRINIGCFRASLSFGERVGKDSQENK